MQHCDVFAGSTTKIQEPSPGRNDAAPVGRASPTCGRRPKWEFAAPAAMPAWRRLLEFFVAHMLSRRSP